MSLVYQNNVLVGTTKVGTVKPDGAGYYEMVLGAFNTDNSGGAYYPLEPFKQLMLSSSDLMRRIKDRALRSEYGHPRRNGMTDSQFLMRVLDILESNTCNHIMRIELDEERVLNPATGQKYCAIIGWIKPSGPMGDVLTQQLQNPEENVCYSIRSITNDHYDSTGKLIKIVKQVVTWDYVNEPGIVCAKKGYSPAVSTESFMSDETGAYLNITKETLKQVKEVMKNQGMGMESNAYMLDELIETGVTRTPKGLLIAKQPASRWTA